MAVRNVPAPRNVEAKPKINLKYQRDKMREKVTGIFRFFEVPGGGISFNYREFKEDPIERFDMTDGETYTIPLGVARHLNKNGWYPEYGYFQAEGSMNGLKTGVPADNRVMRIAKKIYRYGFQSLEFIDIDDIPSAGSEILQVETL
jgi:hypothetical protein